MFINKIKLKNFRNFKDNQFSFDNRIVFIEGNNGSGKTSLLEAIYYTCYLKSFRTQSNKNLIFIGSNYFFTQLDFEDDLAQINQIQVGLSVEDGKHVKLNKKVVNSYKDMVSRFKIVSITEDDLALVQGPPEIRRTFLNQFLIFLNLDNLNILREYKQILQNRNVLFFKKQPILGKQKEELYIWSKQLWEKSIIIQKQRIEFLKQLEKRVNSLLKQYFSHENLSISFGYKSKKIDINQTFDQFWQLCPKVIEDETKWGRSLYGAHLDDFVIIFQNKKARVFASRGQQKLILFLLRVAQLKKLHKNKEFGCLLIDDFLTDFDLKRVQQCLEILRDFEENQIFLTCPLKSVVITEFLKDSKVQVIKL